VVGSTGLSVHLGGFRLGSGQAGWLTANILDWNWQSGDGSRREMREIDVVSSQKVGSTQGELKVDLSP